MHTAKMKVPFSAYLLYSQEEIYTMFIPIKITKVSVKCFLMISR